MRLVEPASTVARSVAQRTLAKREAAYASEVSRLLDAARDLMRMDGSRSAPRVADIVAAAGLSNDAFYRHFPSKSALASALIEDGAQRLQAYVARRMARSDDPAEQVRLWTTAVLSQAEGQVAAQTRAVLWDVMDPTSGLHSRQAASRGLAQLLEPPLLALGSTNPTLHAQLAAHATLGLLADHLQQETTPKPAERAALVQAWTTLAASG